MRRPPDAIRVCIAIGEYPPQFTGHGIQIRRSLPYLLQRGVVPTILAQRLPPPLQPLPPEEERHVHRVLAAGRGVLPTLRRIVRFRRYFGRNRGAFDLIHSSLVGWELLLNIPYLKSLGAPLIHEMVLLDGDDPLTTSRERLGAFKLNRMRRMDGWIGIAAAFRTRLEAVGIPESHFRLIYTGVDVAGYRPLAPDERRAARARLNLPQEARIVVSAGSVIPRKGMDRVLRAWTRTRPVPGRDLLLIIGPGTLEDGLTPGDLDYVRQMRQIAASSGAAGTVRFLGRVDDIAIYLGVADLFLFLSRQEGLGTVILEAMACGLPCMVSPLDGIASETVSEGRTGLIVGDPDDAEAVASGVVRLLSQPALRAALGEEARREAVKRFSFESRAEALSSYYREILEPGSR